MELGLPVAKGTKFRLLKRALYRISWIFLRHQVAFNAHVIEGFEEVAQWQEQLIGEVDRKLQAGLQQLHQEIGDHIAMAESSLTHMQLEIAQIAHGVSELRAIVHGRTPTSDWPSNEDSA